MTTLVPILLHKKCATKQYNVYLALYALTIKK